MTRMSVLHDQEIIRTPYQSYSAFLHEREIDFYYTQVPIVLGSSHSPCNLILTQLHTALSSSSSVCMLSHVQLFATPWTIAHQDLCPYDFPGKNPGVGCHFLLQEIFLTQGLNPCLLCLLHCRWILYCTDLKIKAKRNFYLGSYCWIFQRLSAKSNPIQYDQLLILG